MIWSRSAWRTTIGEDQELGTGRSTCQTILPVAESNASSFDFGVLRRPLIELHQQQVLVRGQRRGVAVAVFGHAEALRPGQLAGKIEGRQIAVGEDGEHAAAVGGGRGRGVAGVVVHFGRLGGALRRAGHGLLPERACRCRRRSNRPRGGAGRRRRGTRACPRRPANCCPAAARAFSRRSPCPIWRPRFRARWCRPRCPARRARGTAATSWRSLPRWAASRGDRCGHGDIRVPAFAGDVPAAGCELPANSSLFSR